MSPSLVARWRYWGCADAKVITQCCVEALYKLGKEYQQVTNLAKTFERRRCNHREAIEPDACLKDVVGRSRSIPSLPSSWAESLARSHQQAQLYPGRAVSHPPPVRLQRAWATYHPLQPPCRPRAVPTVSRDDAAQE